tara:strand:- start:160 stop:309 length:150 start_codon:yes stop_codon:yes gene_type:complete
VSESRKADYFAPSHPAGLVNRLDFHTKENQFLIDVWELALFYYTWKYYE